MHWEKIEIKVKRQEPIPGKSPGRKGGKHGPGRKWGHTLNAVNYGRQVYVFGGYGKDERQTNDVYVYNTTKDAWSKPNIKGTPPSPRDSHTSTVVGSRLFVFGGTDGSSGLNDLYMLDTSTNTWTRLAAQGDVPAAREGHAAARVEGLVYVFGGCGKAGEGGTVDETYYNDVHVFNPDTMRWARVATTGTAPSPRDSHSCCAWGNQLIVFGGEDSRNCYLSDVFVLDTSSLVWREVRARGQKPLPRAGHVAVTAGRYMVVFGGFTDERRLFNDLHVLDLSSEHWQQYTPTGDVPSRRFSLSADLLDTVSGKMMLFGGCNDDLEALEDAYFLHTDFGFLISLSVSPTTPHPPPPSASPHPHTHIPFPCTSTAVPQVAPALPPGLHPADLIAPAGREVPFEAQIVDVFHLGYCLRATVAGRPLHGLLFSYDPSFAQAALARQAQRQAGTRSSRQPPPPPPHLTFSPETGTHTITGRDNSASTESTSSESASAGASRGNDASQVPGRSPSSPNPVPRSRPSDLDIPFDPAIDAMVAAEMAGRKSNEPPPPAEKERQATQLGTLLKQFVRVAAPYWSSEDKGQARLRLAAVFVFALGCTGVSVLFNFLYRDFYNAIASKDEEAFLRQLLWFLGATVGGVPVFVFRDYLRDTLALRWRAWMTTDLLNKYFQHRTFYNIQSQSLIDNPDQRLNDDVDDFTTTSLTFSLALVNAIVDLISFSGILYSIYPPLFAVLLAYSLGGTAISVYLGRELVGLNFLQEKKEADFRYGLVRARENAESIAFYGGERSETRLLLQRFRQSFANYAVTSACHRSQPLHAANHSFSSTTLCTLHTTPHSLPTQRLLVVGRNRDFFTSNCRYLIQLLPAPQPPIMCPSPRHFFPPHHPTQRLLVVGRNLDFFTSNYRYLIQLLPAAVVAPLYFREEIEFGVINQSFSAFNHVLGDFSIIVFQFQALSQFSAIVERLGEFQEVLDDQSKPAALPATSAASAASPVAIAGTTDTKAPRKDSTPMTADSEGERPEGSTQATAAEAAAEHLASLFNSFITIENVILPASAPSLPPALLPASASASASHSSRVLLEVDGLTLCTPQYASCLLSGLSLSVQQGEHLL
ncbi:unnamed protein product, partial [Closterium sp. Yama58-4]